MEAVILAIGVESLDLGTVASKPGNGTAKVVHLPKFRLIKKLQFYKPVNYPDGVPRVGLSIWHIPLPHEVAPRFCQRTNGEATIVESRAHIKQRRLLTSRWNR